MAITDRILFKGTKHEKKEGVIISDDTWKKLWNQEVISKENGHLADDWVMAYREGCDEKYNRVMYSKKLNQIRHLTIDEFYGNGVVD